MKHLNSLLSLEELKWIQSKNVTHVFFESLGKYWIPIFNIFYDITLTLILENPQHIKKLHGRKTYTNVAELVELMDGKLSFENLFLLRTIFWT